MKIVITGGKSATALKLSKAFANDQVILADYGEMPSFKSAMYQFAELGTWNEEILAHHLLTKCLDYEADILIPLYESEINAVGKSLLLFLEFGLKVLVPETVSVGNALNSSKTLAVFDSGKLLYADVENDTLVREGARQLLHGAYYFNIPMVSFSLIQLANPEKI